MQIGNRRRHLLSAGILLFLLALLTGMILPLLANPRMGLSAHLVGLLGGLFLVALGLIWRELDLPRRLETLRHLCESCHDFPGSGFRNESFDASGRLGTSCVCLAREYPNSRPRLRIRRNGDPLPSCGVGAA